MDLQTKGAFVSMRKTAKEFEELASFISDALDSFASCTARGCQAVEARMAAMMWIKCRALEHLESSSSNSCS